MSKRIIVAFSICMVMLCGLSLRLLSVGVGGTKAVGSYNNSRTIKIATMRGNIFDCNMEPMVNSQTDYVALLKPTPAALHSIEPYVGAERMADLAQKASRGVPILQNLPQGAEPGKDMKIAEYTRRYSDKQYAVHLIGYINGDGEGVSGLEKAYNDYLSENGGVLRAAFYVDARGRNLQGLEPEVISEGYEPSAGLVLTIDMNVQRAIEDNLDRFGWESGCAVAVDPKNGEIKAMVSRPNYDPSNVAVSLHAADSPLLNKTLQPFAVGSTFKAIVAAAALENDSLSYEFVDTCTGKKAVSGSEFGCFQKAAHGEQNMEQALVNSCNTYFITLGLNVGAEKVLNLSKTMGFGQAFSLAPGLVSRSGNLPKVREVEKDGAFANLCFGQGTLLATPLQMATAFGAIANGGYRIDPYLLKGFATEGMDISLTGAASRNVASRRTRVLSPVTAGALSDMLVEVVGANEKAKPSAVTAAGKTATAQTGQYKYGEEICHTWFAGWYPAKSPELVIVLMKESGITGSVDCGPVFKNIVDDLTAID